MRRWFYKLISFYRFKTKWVFWSFLSILSEPIWVGFGADFECVELCMGCACNCAYISTYYGLGVLHTCSEPKQTISDWSQNLCEPFGMPSVLQSESKQNVLDPIFFWRHLTIWFEKSLFHRPYFDDNWLFCIKFSIEFGSMAFVILRACKSLQVIASTLQSTWSNRRFMLENDPSSVTICWHGFIPMNANHPGVSQMAKS